MINYDDELKIALEKKDTKFATYLVDQKGANLKRCPVIYEIPLDWRIQALIEAIDEVAPLQFQLTIQQQLTPHAQPLHEVTLNLSWAEASKLANVSNLFQTQWTNSDDGSDFVFISPHDFDFNVFQTAIHAAIGREVVLVPAEHI